MEVVLTLLSFFLRCRCSVCHSDGKALNRLLSLQARLWTSIGVCTAAFGPFLLLAIGMSTTSRLQCSKMGQQGSIKYSRYIFTFNFINLEIYIIGWFQMFNVVEIKMFTCNQKIVRRRDLLPGINGVIGRLNFWKYGLLNLASQDQFWTFSYGCCKENYPRNICSGCYVFDNGNSSSQS
jgi:hypothetical protein